MKGDFTRFTFNPKKHYTGVLKQQGRVDLDADWNEHVEIQTYLDQTQATDIIGACGVPQLGGGFKISLKDGGHDLGISAGRIYVDGILCELEDTTSYLKQAHQDYPNPPSLTQQEKRTDLVYLDVWQRHITAIEDPTIREVALGGPDTTTRLKTVWQVKVKEDVIAGQCGAIAGWPPSASGGQLSTGVTPAPQSEDPCLIAPGTGYRGLENRFYRVEIHTPGDLGAATFKWSRDNGAVVFAITEFVSSDTVKVRRLKWDEVLGLRRGDWVEILDDEHELKGQPGALAKITDVNEAKQTITLSQSITGYDIKGHPKVRRWDQGKAAIQTATGPIELEDGIQVSFSGSNFKTGDYWVFAARTITGDVEELKAAPPRGIVHHYCPLALLTWQKGAFASEGDATLKTQLVEIELALDALAEAGGTVAEVVNQLEQKAKDIQELLAEMAAAGETGERITELELKAGGLKRALQAIEETGAVQAALQKLEAQAAEIAAALEAGEEEIGEASWEATIQDYRRIFPPLAELRSSCCTVTVGDGVCSHGQYDDIQKAIDNLPPHGGRVCILPGQHHLDTSVRIEGKSNIVISGCKPHTWLQIKVDEVVFIISGCATVRVENLGFQLAPGAQAILVEKSADVQVENNLVSVNADQAATLTPVAAQGVIVADACQQIAISQNQLEGGGICILAGSSSVVVERNKIAQGPGHGIAFGASAAEEYAGSVSVASIENVVIQDNMIIGMQGSGIAVNAQPNSDMPSLLITTDNLTVERNTILACAQGATDDGVSVHGGIVLAGGKQLRIQGNRIEACGPIDTLPATSDEGGPSSAPTPGTPTGTIHTPDFPPALAVESGETPSAASVNLSPVAGRLMARPLTGIHFARSAEFVEPVLAAPIRYLDVTGAEEIPAAPVAGIYVFHSEGLEISHNHVLNNGSPRVGAQAAGRQGGIIVRHASICPLQIKISDRMTLTFSDGYPAAKVHANTVIAPRGPALQVAGIGPMSITDNQLTSQGAFPLPQGEDTPSLQSIGVAQIVNLGVADELISFFPGFQKLVGAHATIDLSSQPAAPPSAGADTIQLRFDGSVLFSDNQVTLNLARPEQELAPASVLIVSLDDVAFHDNQLDAVLPAQDAVMANAVVMGIRARATGNVFKETIAHCYYSYIAMALVNTATDNQGNHCFFVYSPDASKLVNQNNLALACKLDNAAVTHLVVAPALSEEASAASTEASKVATAYRSILASADLYRPRLLQEFRAIQEVKVQRLQAKKNSLAAQPEAAAWQITAIDRELAAANVIHARLDNLVTFEANLPRASTRPDG